MSSLNSYERDIQNGTHAIVISPGWCNRVASTKILGQSEN